MIVYNWVKLLKLWARLKFLHDNANYYDNDTKAMTKVLMCSQAQLFQFWRIQGP